ncbi:flagellin N-terminal helical domain-containing protein [Salinibius halmophilus]|uniref:flagellin N-terminal helical domain-containing protein n=1 Tax=Salinibius halmophilus TaxID=1853216 RepID=UPI000E6693A2|nr:flagellin [Salinibius halmophilus]
MPQIINTNIASLTAQRNLDRSQSANETALNRLSSGLRINSAKDDAAGLAISTRFESQTKGLAVAIRNAGDGISLSQTAEGALQSMTDGLQRIRELAVQSSNATNSDDDRLALQAEVKQLVSEITRTSEETTFNGRKLFDGDFNGTFQIGANAGQTVDIEIGELTAAKLGASDQVGVTAVGSNSAIENGDLTINGVAIAASKAEDDTASTAESAASAIAKAAAINRFTDQTGVKAFANENVAAGSEMSGSVTSGTLKLNGVEIELSTTTNTSQTRAAVEEAINSVANQTGVRAIAGESDAEGVTLIAEDGRNIELDLDFSGTLTAAATGLASDAQVYTGGYTLIAEGDVKSIEIEGGNGTGKGDIDNAGLVAGTYDRATAVNVSEVKTGAESAASIGGGSIEGTLTKTAANFTAVGDAAGTAVNTFTTAVAITNDLVVSLGATGTGTIVAADVVAAMANGSAGITGRVAGVTAFEKIDLTLNIAEFGNSDTAAGSFTIDNQVFSIPAEASTSLNDASEQQAYAENLVDSINNATFTGVASSDGGYVVASLSADKLSVNVSILNAGSSSLAFGTDGTADIGVVMNGGASDADFAVGASTNEMQGNLVFVSDNANDVELTFSNGTGATDFFTTNGVVKSLNSYGTEPTGISTESEVDINIKVGTQDLSPITIAAGSNVSDIAAQIDAEDGVSAWEEISVTFTAQNLEAGDQLTLTGGSSGASFTITSNSAGNVTLASIVDDFNNADFATEDLQVSAELAADGNSFTLNINNYSSNNVQINSTNSQGRGLSSGSTQISTEAVSVGGKVAFQSDTGEDVTVSMSDPEATGKLFTGSSGSGTYDGINGLQDGDLLINGVSIGSAKVGEDTASAVLSSDGFKIQSSEKSLSGIAVAAAINEVSEETGVTATVLATEVVGGEGAEAADAQDFSVGDEAGIYLNGVSVGTVTLQAEGDGVTIDLDRARADALNLINQNSEKTGVMAVDNGESLTLTASDGRNISVAIDDRSGNSDSIGKLFGLDKAVDGIGESTFGASENGTNAKSSAEAQTYETTYSQVKLESAGTFEVSVGTNGADEVEALGLSVGTFGGGEDGQFLKDIDISTFEGAQAAITAVDNALDTVASTRADLGAIQNRFESTISNLTITSENLTAANSRIRDADFAAETAELSRTQVLQQAGISILAQANQRPQQVLSLLG